MRSCTWRCWAGTPAWGTTPWAGNPSCGSCSYELYASYSLFSPHGGQGDILTMSITSGPSFAYPLSHGFSSLPGNSRLLALTFIVQHDLPLPTFWPRFASLSSLLTVLQLPGHLSAFFETPPPLHPWFLLPEKLWQDWILLITQVSVQISRFYPSLIFSPSFCLWSTDHHLKLSIYLFIHWLVYCLPHPTGPQAPKKSNTWVVLFTTASPALNKAQHIVSALLTFVNGWMGEWMNEWSQHDTILGHCFRFGDGKIEKIWFLPTGGSWFSEDNLHIERQLESYLLSAMCPGCTEERVADYPLSKGSFPSMMTAELIGMFVAQVFLKSAVVAPLEQCAGRHKTQSTGPAVWLQTRHLTSWTWVLSFVM